LEESVKNKMSFRKLVLGLVIVLSLLMSVTAYAQTEDVTVELLRLGGTYVGIKITFPTEISGNFSGMLASKGFDCLAIPTNVVYCIGPFQKGAGPSTLFLIDQDTKEVVLEKVVSPPKPIGYGDENPEPIATKVPECGECSPQ
jgi:hypothetical protein